MLNERWNIDKEERREGRVSLPKEWAFTLNTRWDTAVLSKEIREEYVGLLKIRKEEREIAKHLAQTSSNKRMRYLFYVMTKDKTIYDFSEYRDLLKSNRVSPNNAYVYLENNYFVGYDLVSYLYPFLHQGVPLVHAITLINAYLSKLGFENEFYPIAPATGLKYIAMLYKYPDVDRIAVEVADIDTVATNTSLLALIHNVLGTKRMTDDEVKDDEVKEITSQFISQKLFAGHTFIEAQDIIREYYKNHNASLAKEVEAIKEAYNRIFRQFRLEYDLNTKQFQGSDRS